MRRVEHRYAGIGGWEPFPNRRRFKKGGTSAPPAADPSLVAGSQLNANLQTAQAQSALNNVRTTSPLGQSFFEQGPDGRWSLNQSLDPSVSPVYGAQTALATTLGQLGQEVAKHGSGPAEGGANVTNAGVNTFLPQIVANPSANLQTDLGLSGLGAVPTPNPNDYARGINYGSLGPLPSPNPGDYTKNLNYGQLGALPTPNTAAYRSALDFGNNPNLDTAQFGPQIQAAQDAAYNAQAAYLDPRYENKTNDLRQQLADEGIPVGSDAYNRAQGELEREKTMAYQQAQDAAVLAGQAQQARLFQEELQAQQECAAEISTSGTFQNQTQNQILQNQLASRQQGAGEIQTGGAFTNATLASILAGQLASRGQGANELQTGATFQNATNQQLIGDLLASRQQAASELQAGGTFRNAALQQNWQNPYTALGSLAGTGTGITGSAASNLATLNPLSGFEWAGQLPTFGGSPTAVAPANVVGAQQAANQANAARFAGANTLNNTLFNGLGTLGSSALSGTGAFGSGGVFGGLFGGGAAPALTSAGTFFGDPAAATAAGFAFPGSAAAPLAGLTADAGISAGGGGLLSFLLAPFGL